MKHRHFKIGTRTSLLAWRQSEMVRDLIQSHYPEIDISMEGIQTRGDQIQDRPLTELEGKDFFVAELDKVLLAGETDFTIHSLKDLSTERPENIYLAAIPPRYAPHDILIFAPGLFEKDHFPKSLTIGTGSPRRKSCIEKHLAALVPHEDTLPQVQCQPIRGNVETRLQRLYKPSERFPQVDGVVLAMAGLERLWSHPETRKALMPLLENTRHMVLPLTLFPTAPGQAALAIECRADDEQARRLLEPLHCQTTARLVKIERTLLSALGGGCHLPLGATAITHEHLGEMMWSSAPDQQGELLTKINWAAESNLPSPAAMTQVIDGVSAKASKATTSLSFKASLPKDAHIFVAHRRALPNSLIQETGERKFWVPGVGTWRKLASEGLFVTGSTDGLGWQRMSLFQAISLLGLPQPDAWHVLTHDEALGWDDTEVVAHHTYSFEKSKDLGFEKSLKKSSHVFWGSARQLERYHSVCPTDVHHACGPGKTADHLVALGLSNYTIFPSRSAWQAWIEAPDSKQHHV